MRRALLLSVWLGSSWALAQTAQSGAPAAVPAATDKPRLFITAVVAQGVASEEAAAISDAVVSALAGRGLFEVVSTRDMQTLLGTERQKQLLGLCERDAAACDSTAAEAVTARFLLSGQLSKVGNAYQLSLQMLDTQKGQPVARSMRLAADLKALAALVPYVAAEATGSPLPPPPSRVLPISVIAAGAAAFLAGAVLGLQALSRESVLTDELCPEGVTALTRCTALSLRPRSYYLEQNAALGTQKSLSLGLLVGGAALSALGLWLMPSSDASPRVALAPSTNGLFVVGWWP